MKQETVVVLILIFGALTIWAGIEILLRPHRICGYVNRNSAQPTVHILNVVIRIVFGFTLLSLTSQSRLPLLTDMIGWFCLGLAIILTLMGRDRFIGAFLWAITLVENNYKIASFLIMLFGAFLIYAFV